MRSSRALLLSFAERLPERNVTLRPSGESQPLKVFACCSARSSVGAMRATWHPADIALMAALAATRVLPEPTSPWTRRIIGWAFLRSAAISPETLSCALVGVKGSEARNFSSSSDLPLNAGARSALFLALSSRIEMWWAASSSAMSLLCAGIEPLLTISSVTPGGGACRVLSASASETGFFMASSGISSSMPRSLRRSRASPAIFRMNLWLMPSVSG